MTHHERYKQDKKREFESQRRSLMRRLLELSEREEKLDVYKALARYGPTEEREQNDLRYREEKENLQAERASLEEEQFNLRKEYEELGFDPSNGL